MRGSRPLIVLLLAAIVVVDLAAFSLVRARLLDDLCGILFVSFMLSQASLLGIWAALGRPKGPWRLTGLVAGAILLALVLARATPFAEAVSLYARLFLAQGAMIVAPLGVLRLCGIAVLENRDLGSCPDNASSRRPPQFSLGYLFAWTTALAVCLGLVRYFLRYDLSPVEGFLRRDLAAITASGAMIALTVLWLVLGSYRVLVRHAAVGLAAVATTLLVRAWGPPGRWNEAADVLVQVVWLAASLGVLRIAGYRLVIGRVGGEPTDPAPPEAPR